MDCSGETPEKYEYPPLPVVAGNLVECSCVIEASHNDSGYPEFITVCLDQCLYYVTIQEVTEIQASVGL